MKNTESLELQTRYKAPSSWWEHVPIAHWLVATLKPNKIIELGSHYGVSFFAFCEAAERFSPDTYLYAVDTWEGDVHAGKYTENVYRKVLKHQQTHHRQRSDLIRTTFAKAAAEFPENTFDIIHIDGLHTYEAVREDYDMWSEKLVKNGSLIFHDWNVREKEFGVWKLWEEIKSDERYKCIEIPNGHGLGIATLTDEIPDWHNMFVDILPLLKMKGKLLAQEQSLEEKIDQQQEKISELSRHRNNLEEENKYYKVELEKLQAQMKSIGIKKIVLRRLKQALVKLINANPI